MQENKLDWLRRRKITDAVLKESGVHVGEHPLLGSCIVIPVDGIFNKYRRDPLDNRTPKYLYDKDSKVALYGASLIKDSSSVLITEGEFDSLVARSFNIPAVSSTGGCRSFQDEWVPLFEGKDVTICYDNDDAGADGAVSLLKKLPSARVALIPETPGVKDISDYVSRGGDLAELIRNAVSVFDIQDDRASRLAQWQSTRFHDAWIADQQKSDVVEHRAHKPQSDRTEVENARAYPMENLLSFNKAKKALCVWHNDTDPSLHYYPKTNTVYCFSCGKYGDSIDVYRAQTGCTFTEALKKLV